MYVVIVFLTNLWMRLFPNYTDYFKYSSLAQSCDNYAFNIYCYYWTMASTVSRGFLLPEQLAVVEEQQCIAYLLDRDARLCMQQLTVEDLKTSIETKLGSYAYNVSTRSSEC